MKKAFTLIEVNMAMLIMAGGIFSIVGLYAFGFRENRQSNEDVQSAAYADAVISPLVMAITSTNLSWSSFQSEWNYPDNNGWSQYFDEKGLVKSDPDTLAKSVYQSVMSKLSRSGVTPAELPEQMGSGKLHAGLVVMHEANSAVVRISFRASQLPSKLLSAPLYYTEARFQGVMSE